MPGCVYYDFGYYKLSNLTYQQAAEAVKTLKEKPPIRKCKSYIFEHDVPKEISPIREVPTSAFYIVPPIHKIYALRFNQWAGA